MKKAIFYLLAALIIFAVSFFALLTIESRPVDAHDSKTVYVTVDEGESATGVAGMLAERGLLRSELAFKLRAKMSGKGADFKAGAYAVKKSMSAGTIIDMIADGRTAGKSFRIIEGLSLDKIAAELESQDICSKEEFFNEVENGQFDYPFVDLLPTGITRFEGFLYPDTYTIAANAGAHEAIDVMLKNFNTYVTDEYYKKADATGKGIYDIIIEASVIQREASLEDDMANVASVIDNRIAGDMYLQMDSIISYIKKEDKVIATYSDIAVESDYNPYTNKGLPPGPICSPGIKAIDAALDPSQTKYLFFVNSDKLDGSLTFCENETQFAKAKASFEKAYQDYLKEHPEEKNDNK